MSELRAKLGSELLPSEWKMLAMHAKREALFVVDAKLPLLEVAVAVAEDQSKVLAAWIEAELIRRPTEEEVARWEPEEGALFVSVILQPWVFAQRLDDFAASHTGDQPPS